MTKDEALRLALEALKETWYHVGTFAPTDEAIELYDKAIKACEEALAQPKPEILGNVDYIPCCTDQTCPKCKPPQTEPESVKLKPEDVLVESCVVKRGGFILKTSEGVRLTHRPTGRVIEVCEERSQHRNRAIAWEMLERLVAQEQPEQDPPYDMLKKEFDILFDRHTELIGQMGAIAKSKEKNT